jgi:hypothetical protein
MVKTTVAAACVVAVAVSLRAQTRIDLRTQASSVVDFGTATYTRPVRTGTSLPAQCETGELFFKTDAPAGANVYSCVSHNAWAAPAVPAVGPQLPSAAGHATKSLWTDGVSAVWKNVTTGATGALALTQNGSEVALDIVPSVIPQKSAANVFTGLNTFGSGIQLLPQTAPASPENGRMWYDSTLHRFRCHQNGVTSDCASAGTARTIVAGSGIVVADGDGVNGNPTISATSDLLNLTASQNAATALMGPANGAPGAPSFRALTETDLPGAVALKPAANTFTSLNTFDSGIQLSPQAEPASPENGRMWYDSTLHKFRCHQNGVTSDCASAGTARTIVAGSGIVVADGDGVNGNPTISATSDLLNLTASQNATTALMGPANGGPGAPSFRALTETDLPGAVALKPAANTFTSLNTFDSGIQLSPQAEPASPENGRMWYDSTLHKFRCHQNGVTSDCASAGTARTIVAGSGIVVADGDGVNGDPTISATSDLLNLTASQSVATALMGPANGGPGTPSFRALTETDLPGAVALKPVANTFTSLNTFDSGIQLSPQTAPVSPENGRMWYDSAAGRFRARENGQTVDLRPGGSGVADPGANGIMKRTALNTTAPAVAGTDYVGPTTGSAIQKANGSGGLTPATAGVDYAAASHTHSYPVLASAGVSVGANSIQYTNITGGSFLSSTNTRQSIMPVSGTLSHWYLRMGSAHSGDMTCAIYKNGDVTSFTITIPDGGGFGSFSNTSGSVSFAAGDRLLVGCDRTGFGSSSGFLAGWSFLMTY